MSVRASGRRERPPFAVQLKPHPGETLYSWLRNCAHLTDVSLVDLFIYLELPREWAHPDLSRGVWVEGRHSAEDTKVLLHVLCEAFEMPIEALQALIIHTPCGYLRSRHKLVGCPACAVTDAAHNLLPRIQRRWLLKCCTHCPVHGTVLRALDPHNQGVLSNTDKRRSKNSGLRPLRPPQQDFMEQIYSGLLLGWDPACDPASIRVCDTFGVVSTRVARPQEREARRDPFGHCGFRNQTISWFVQETDHPEGQRAQPVFGFDHLFDLMLGRDRTRRCFIVHGTDGVQRAPLDRLGASLIEVQGRLASSVQQRLGAAEGELAALEMAFRASHNAAHSSLVMAHNALVTCEDALHHRLRAARWRLQALAASLQRPLDGARRRLERVSRRFEDAKLRHPGKRAIYDQRGALQTEIARARAALGSHIGDHTQALRQRSRDYLRASDLGALDLDKPAALVWMTRRVEMPECPKGMVRQ